MEKFSSEWLLNQSVFQVQDSLEAPFLLANNFQSPTVKNTFLCNYLGPSTFVYGGRNWNAALGSAAVVV